MESGLKHLKLPFLLAIGFSSLFLLTNLFDWDFVFTTLEVDIRSFVLDGKIPTWSYQMCAGSTRSGDPQSYSLSPLFIFPLLFGSFLGAKFLLFLATFVGTYYLSKMINLLYSELKSIEKSILIGSFLVGNFFLFHFSEGHLSFSSLFYAFPLLYLCLASINGQRLNWKDLTYNSFFLFLLLTGGFYQASIYFIAPLALCFAIYLFLTFRSCFDLKNNIKIVISCIVPLVFSWYRLEPVLNYQEVYPRSMNTIEYHGLYDQLLYFIAPIYNKNYLFNFRTPYYSAGEDSFFGGIVILFIILLFLNIKKWTQIKVMFNGHRLFSLILIIVGVSFSMGNQYKWQPISLLNLVLNGSLRVASRFNFLTYLGLFFLTLDLWKNLQMSQKIKRVLLAFTVLVSTSCLLQHYTSNHFNVSMYVMNKTLNLKPNYTEKMQHVYLTKATDNFNSYMLTPVMLGFSVANCYQPMNRETYLTGPEFRKLMPMFEWHFMQTSSSEQNEKCLMDSYFTQSDLTISTSCKSGSRIHLNFIRPQHLIKYNINVRPEGYFLQ